MRRLPRNFYPRPPRGGRLSGLCDHARHGAISIHALREEGDEVAASMPAWLEDFYPRPPRGGRLKLISFKATLYRFLSTPSARRATLFLPTSTSSGRISIHASARRATLGRHRRVWCLRIFIHALREEGDEYSMTSSGPMIYFYPRPPRGGRHAGHVGDTGQINDFYPRPPRGGRPTSARKGKRYRAISIHALREEGDIRATTLSA